MDNKRLQSAETKGESGGLSSDTGPLAQLAEQRAFNPLASQVSARGYTSDPADTGLSQLTAAIAARFWSRVDARDLPGADPAFGSCWPWLGYIAKDGYGRSSLAGKSEQAHRAAWKLTHGDIPDGLLVRHQCDVKACCRPSHLLLGTHQQNADDAVERGRLAGINTHQAKLPGVAPSDDSWMAPWLVTGIERPTIPMVMDALPKRRRTRANAVAALNKLAARRRELGAELSHTAARGGVET